MDIRSFFPLLSQTIDGKPLVYLDNAATSQKPQVVIDTVNELHTSLNGNIHRGVHRMAEQCTVRYEAARESVRGYINAAKAHEVIFTAGTTAGINLVAFAFGERYVKAGDEILVTEMEHHSNIVPWQLLCERKGATLRVLPFADSGELRMDMLPALISKKTRLLAVAHVSNVLGTVNPVAEISCVAHALGVPVLVDGAQGVPHGPVDVQQMDCDFYAFSGHKVYGPTGIGVLYAKEEYLNEMPPYQGGGDMVKSVTFAKTAYADLPYKFEAGTANYIGAIGLGAAIEFSKSLNANDARLHEEKLLRCATERLQSIGGLAIYGSAPQKSGIVSFAFKNIHHLDVAQVLDKQGIAVRSGTLCAEPVMQRYGLTGMVRASFACYNTVDEVRALAEGLERAKSILS
ncbi:MAG: SufS family cysteine desulfurase [Prevotellaceae bacterium]|jgi:cysteine desulfurase/selenocysteine lyase|nr:SufS family cysteine desulfurase [Prevotellaceae bacterium]